MSRVKTVKAIDGVDAEDYFGTVIGPMAAKILEMTLWKHVQNGAKDMTGAELKLVQFAIERTYGAATRQVEHVKVSDQQIVADQLAELDPLVLRQIADTKNAPRLS